MDVCPNCKKSFTGKTPDCPHCGIFFDKFIAQRSSSADVSFSRPIQHSPARTPQLNKLWLILGVVVVGVILLKISNRQESVPAPAPQVENPLTSANQQAPITSTPSTTDNIPIQSKVDDDAAEK